MNKKEFKHIPVLFNEVISELNIKEDGIYIDGTVGGAGHSSEILKKLKTGLLIGVDRDKEALKAANNKLQKISTNAKYILKHNNFKNIPEILKEENIKKVDGILLDLGVSSYQIDTPERGFSYMQDAPLDMRMNTENEISAWDIVNKYSEDNLADIFFQYGEEKFAKRIARKILEVRKIKAIDTTGELVNLIDQVVPFSKKGGHKAKRVFQALRIEVNKELEELGETVYRLIKCLKIGGRLNIITFHSLEDKIVKKAMNEMEGKCICPKELPYCVCNRESFGKLLTRKPILPSKEEMKINSRSQSAKLRVFERR